MSDLKIIGNANPVVGEKEIYSVNDVFGNIFPDSSSIQGKNDPFESMTKWSIHVLDRGVWRKTKENDKTGTSVPYTFYQKSISRKGLKIMVEREGKVAALPIKTQNAAQAKLVRIELLDKSGHQIVKPFGYGQTLIARIHCVHMELRPVTVMLWEDDSKGSGHDAANSKIQVKTKNVFNGKADVEFFLSPDISKIANARLAKGDTDEGKTHEYYVTAEIFYKEPKILSSVNTNVENPDYKVRVAKSKPPSPASTKGKSKKEQKGIKTNEEVIHDHHETTISVWPIILPDPLGIINSVMKVFMPDEKEEENKKGVCFNCDKDITLDEIEKMFGVIPKYKVFREEIVKYVNEYVKLSKKRGKPIHLDSCLRKAHFFAQVGTETLGINPDWMVETDSIRYNVSNCIAVFGQRAKILEKEGLLDDYCSDNPQKRLLNYIYASENGFGNGNGNEASGDGYKFRGRGLKQLTGRGNYKDITKILKEVFPDEFIDLELNPDKVKESKYAVLTALAFWEKHEIWKVADIVKESTNENIKKIRKKVNPGLAGWKECKTYFGKGLEAFKLSECRKDKVGSDSEENEVKLHFIGTTANESDLSTLTKKILKEVGRVSSNYDIYITSIARISHDQARIMYNNCMKNLREQRNTYKEPGQRVIDVYENETKNGKPKEKIIEMMENKINELGPSTVSKHLANPSVLNTFDVAYKLLSNKTKFFNEIKKRNELDEILVENDCYHIQIKQ